MNALLRLYPGDVCMLLIANSLIGVTLILLAALLLVWIGRRASGAWRYGICLVAVVSVLVNPALSYLLPTRGLAFVTFQPHAASSSPIEADRNSPPPLQQASRSPTSPRSTPAGEPPQQAPQHEVRYEGATTLSVPDVWRAIAGLTLLIWLCGVALLLARWYHGLRQISAFRKNVRLLEPGELSDVLPDVRSALGVERLPPVAASSDLSRPIMVGLIKPLVILPERVIRILNRNKLADILVHECAHSVCRHQLVGVLQRASAVLFWPHPLVHLLNRELARAREEVCDNYVLRFGDTPRYARTLLELSDLLCEAPSDSMALGLFHCQWRLEDRIAGLLDHRRRNMTRVNRWATAAVAIAFSLVGATQFLQAEPTETLNTELAAAVAALSDASAKSSPSVADTPAPDSELSQSATNLREIMSAIHTYHGIAGHYPAAGSGWGYDRKEKQWFRERPYLSWRVLLLPLLGEAELFEKFRLGEPWDSEHNRSLIPLMPKIYRAPGSTAEVGKTNYLGAIGPNAAFPDKGAITIPDIIDGTSKTIMLVEVSDQAAVEWTRPEDFPVDTKEPLKKLIGLRKDGFLTAFADGSPQFISSDIPPEMLKLFFCRNDMIVIADEAQRFFRFVKPGTKQPEVSK